MGFPTSPSNEDVYTNANGTRYQYDSTDNKWVVIGGAYSVDTITANQFNGGNFNGAQITGTSLLINGNFSGAQITGTSGLFNTLQVSTVPANDDDVVRKEDLKYGYIHIPVNSYYFSGMQAVISGAGVNRRMVIENTWGNFGKSGCAETSIRLPDTAVSGQQPYLMVESSGETDWVYPGFLTGYIGTNSENYVLTDGWGTGVFHPTNSFNPNDNIYIKLDFNYDTRADGNRINIANTYIKYLRI